MGLGFEPRFSGSKPLVLPLNDPTFGGREGNRTPEDRETTGRNATLRHTLNLAG